jgi:hypothetical protein
MNRAMGAAMVKRKTPGYMFGRIEGTFCSYIYGTEKFGRPECQSTYETFVNKSVFMPTSCRAGDGHGKTDGYKGIDNIVTCLGKIDTPKASTSGRLVFSRVVATGEWRAVVAEYSRDEWTEH